MQCVAACQAGAIDHNQKPETTEIEVGAVILSPGFQTFDPSKYKSYHYANYPNVVTSLEFERILSASGPFGGHLVRPSDHKEPKKIAWLQCVGSRDVKYHSYCSSVCCMYAIKEAVIAKEHARTTTWTPPSSSWTCAPSARSSSSITTGPNRSRGCASSAPGSTPSTRPPTTTW